MEFSKNNYFKVITLFQNIFVKTEFSQQEIAPCLINDTKNIKKKRKKCFVLLELLMINCVGLIVTG